ncbi:MAG: hypothetical protein PsegKO_25370 [Pseudohongiellaceae bacterium]
MRAGNVLPLETGEPLIFASFIAITLFLEEITLYGMIHKSIHGMVVEHLGEEGWQKIAKQAEVDEQHLLSMESYDDHIVYDLVEAAADCMNLKPDQILEDFGRHFVNQTLSNNYQNLLKSYGQTSFELLDNLNKLHTSIKTTFTGYRPPAFTVRYIMSDEIDLFYESERIGLSPFVRGLLAGIADLYGETLVIAFEEKTDVPEGEQTLFRVVREIPK